MHWKYHSSFPSAGGAQLLSKAIPPAILVALAPVLDVLDRLYVEVTFPLDKCKAKRLKVLGGEPPDSDR